MSDDVDSRPSAAAPAGATAVPTAKPAGGLPGRSWPRIGPWRLMLIFSQITIQGFGGVLPFAYRALVERRKLVDNKTFGEMFAFGQVMPGPAVGNFAFIFGYRDSGVPGALGAVIGIVTLPFLLLVALGMFYFRFSDLEAVRQALAGMASVTGGLVVAVALKMSQGIHRDRTKFLLMAGTFAAFGLMRWPFLGVIAVAGPLAFWLSWREQR